MHLCRQLNMVRQSLAVCFISDGSVLMCVCVRAFVCLTCAEVFVRQDYCRRIHTYIHTCIYLLHVYTLDANHVGQTYMKARTYTHIHTRTRDQTVVLHAPHHRPQYMHRIVASPRLDAVDL